jgi:hypothetical protein
MTTMSDPSRQQVLDAIDKGIRKAQKDYKDVAWTPLCRGPEYLMTVGIFYSLLGLTKKDSLTLENRPTDLLEWLNEEKSPPMKPESVPRGSGRIDICLWHKGENKPRAIIEVKRCAMDWKKYTKRTDKDTDLDRISNLILNDRVHKFEFGVLASCIHRVLTNNDRNQLERKINDDLQSLGQAIEEKVNSQLGVNLQRSGFKLLPLKRHYRECEECDDWIWRPVVFTIYRKPNRG